eukprot:GILJ01000991.1.p1 GENE.GILJ01000991.1~~GILJ01000991.1.p1  ORF type:complete len:473 (+),score=75.57 GILJ01000991.1:57-1421(+)
MNYKSDRERFQEQAEEYLEKNNVYDLFERLLKDLIVNLPADPLQHLIGRLQTNPGPKIILLGAPGSGRSTQSQSICQELGTVHISVGDLLRQEIAANSALGQQVKDDVLNGRLVRDDLIIDIVKQKVRDEECIKKGWVLDGFPRTRVQGQSLQRDGIIPDKFILLNVTEDTVYERLRKKAVQTNSEEDSEKVVKVRVQQFYRHLYDTLDLYKGIVHNIDAVQPVEKVTKDIMLYLHMKDKSNAPRRPLRIAVVGPPGSGRTSQCAKLAARFGVVHISPWVLLKEEVARQTELGNKIKSAIRHGDLVSDDIINQVLEERLRQNDCKQQGWVLDGTPKTILQAQMLARMNYAPTRVVVLELSDDLVIDRLSNRRVDPATGITYHLDSNVPEDEQVRERLVIQQDDIREVVTTRLQRYRGAAAELIEHYQGVARTFNADQDPVTLSEEIGYYVERPL